MRVVLVAFTNIEYTIELGEGLSKLIDVTLMIPEKQARLFEKVINTNLNVKPFKHARLREIKNLVFIHKIINSIKKLNPHIIHIQRGHPWFNLMLPFLRQYALVTTIHDVNQHLGDKESKKIPNFTHYLAIKYAKKIIVHGQILKSEFLKKTKKMDSDVIVIPRGINSIYKRYDNNFIKEDDYTILFFGRIFEYKGLRYLIEAEPLITNAIPKVKIIIAGRGDNVINKYEKYMVNKNKFIIYNEHISNHKVYELFSNASIVVLPYVEASQSGVIPLAYAFKKPVVATNVGCLPDVIENNKTGFVVQPANSIQLADAIIKLLKNKKMRKQFGINALKKAKIELSWDAIAKKTVSVYKDALFKYNSN